MARKKIVTYGPWIEIETSDGRIKGRYQIDSNDMMEVIADDFGSKHVRAGPGAAGVAHMVLYELAAEAARRPKE